jgi:hypothetical protein
VQGRSCLSMAVFSEHLCKVYSHVMQHCMQVSYAGSCSLKTTHAADSKTAAASRR